MGQADAISRSAALEMAYCAINPTQDCPNVVSVVSVEDIENLPALDVAPVVHARWTDDGICTECGNEAPYSEWFEKQFDYDWDENLIYSGERTHRDYNFTKYCPNCGARMDGEAE